MILYNNIYANLDELLTGRPLKIAQNLSATKISNVRHPTLKRHDAQETTLKV